MTPWVHHILATALTTAIKVLPEPGERPSWRQAWRALRGRSATLDYKISQQELSHIFRLSSSAYIGNQNEHSVKIREMAGHSYTGPHQEVSGFGQTQVLHADQFSIYINKNESGVFSSTGGVWEHARNVLTHIQHTTRNLPRAFMNLKKLQALVVAAHDYKSPGSLCQMSIVAHTHVFSQPPLTAIFIIQAEYMTDHQNDAPVVIRHIIRPILDDKGRVKHEVRIKPDNPEAAQEVLRFLIFAKLVINQAITKQPIDIERYLHDVSGLGLEASSRLKDYLGFQPSP